MSMVQWEACVRRALSYSLALFCALAVLLFRPTDVLSAVTSTTLHGVDVDRFDPLISNSDLIQGQNTLDVDVYENPVDSFGRQPLPGWHPANTNPADQLAAFTDGAGILASGLTGLLNDNNVDDVSGRPAKIVEYPLASASDIGRINLFTGNRNNADSRIFSTVYIEYSTDNAFTFDELGYFQSDPSGTINDESNPASTFDPLQRSTIVSIFDSTNPTMLSGVTNIIFNFYSGGADIDPESPLRGIHGDPYDGVSQITGIDDGVRSAFVSPLVLEIDVLAPSAVLAGDYNGNGTVDAADYTLWRDTLGDGVASGSGADGSGNGVVDVPDYDLWRLYYGASSGLGSGATGESVPEPSTFGMSALVFCLMFGVRWFRRSAVAYS